MTLDAFTDPVTDALRLVIRDNVNEALRDITGDDDAIETTYGFPILLSQIKRDALPALIVVGRGERRLRMGRHSDLVRNYTITYISPAPSMERLASRWLSLNAVKDAMVDALDGVHVTSEVNVLEAAGVVQIIQREIVVTFDYLDAENTQYPAFQAVFPVRVRPISESEAVPLTALFAEYHLTDPPTGDDPIVEDLSEL